MIGRTITHYQVLEMLGQGGMGVVYKARDTQLDRLVALKVLTPDKVANQERKLRFVQEAKAASALNHPNIVTIYDIGCEDGVDYIVMEFVDGRTLDRIIPRGGLKLGELLKYAIPVADALARAHSAGIVHRDLKPGNIMVAEDQVKLLDFGLAKLSDLHDAPDAELTRQGAPETSEGSILGTVSYMSPEQAEARKVDARSDIFSFGAVLYEMATGQRAFLGRSKISTLAAILQSDPRPPAELHAGVPAELAKIILRCLRKDPAWRFQSAADLKISLFDLQRESDSGVPATPAVATRARRVALPRAAVLVVGLAIGAAGAWWLAGRMGRSAANVGPVKPLTTYTGLEYEPALSPDGNQIAFAWEGDRKENFDIYVRLVEGGAALRLTKGTKPAHSPAWSPDGRRLAFVRDDAVYTIPALGGVERKLAQFPGGHMYLNAYLPSSLSWSPDGRFIAFNGSSDQNPPRVWIVPTDTGEPHEASTPPKGYYAELSPAFSPNGRTLAYIRGRDMYSRAVLLQDIERDGHIRGKAREATSYDESIQELAWQADGRGLILAIRQGGERSGLFRLTLGGAMHPLGLDSGIARWPSVSRVGNRLAYEKRLQDANIYRMDGPGPDGGPRAYNECHVAVVVDSTAQDREPRLSPDAKRIVFNSDRTGFYEIHTANLDGSNQVALTSMGRTAMGSPRWSSDGQMVVFDRYENGHSMIYAMNAERGKPQPVTGQAFRDIRPSFSVDSAWIYFASNRSGPLEIWKVAAGGGPVQQITKGGGNEPFESPDGKFLYYMKDPGGIWRMPVAGGQPEPVVREARMFMYAAAGRSIYFCTGPKSLWVLRTDSGRKFEYVQFPKEVLGLENGSMLSVSADERTIIYTQMDRQESDLMLVENFK
jgi:Tol biopolymer transport system component/tRNA A-37 threonylcarbamoyl transferase component Bud32